MLGEWRGETSQRPSQESRLTGFRGVLARPIQQQNQRYHSQALAPESESGLAQLITETIGKQWITDLDQLQRLEPLADDADFQERFFKAKRRNKEALAQHIRRELGIAVSPDSLFDVQVKRLHEYKRQLLFVLYIIANMDGLNGTRRPASFPARSSSAQRPPRLCDGKADHQTY